MDFFKLLKHRKTFIAIFVLIILILLIVLVSKINKDTSEQLLLSKSKEKNDTVKSFDLQKRNNKELKNKNSTKTEGSNSTNNTNNKLNVEKCNHQWVSLSRSVDCGPGAYYSKATNIEQIKNGDFYCLLCDQYFKKNGSIYDNNFLKDHLLACSKAEEKGIVDCFGEERKLKILESEYINYFNVLYETKHGYITEEGGWRCEKCGKEISYEEGLKMEITQ